MALFVCKTKYYVLNPENVLRLYLCAQQILCVVEEKYGCVALPLSVDWLDKLELGERERERGKSAFTICARDINSCANYERKFIHFEWHFDCAGDAEMI